MFKTRSQTKEVASLYTRIFAQDRNDDHLTKLIFNDLMLFFNRELAVLKALTLEETHYIYNYQKACEEINHIDALIKDRLTGEAK